MSISRWVLIPAGLLWLVGCQSTGLTAAKLYLKQEKPQQAKAQLESALQVQPDDPEIHYLLGKIAGTERRYTEMARHFERSLEIGPRFQQEIRKQRRYYWALLYNRGVGENSAKDPDLAEMREFFRLATVVQPGRLEARLTSHRCADESGRYLRRAGQAVRGRVCIPEVDRDRPGLVGRAL